MTEEKNQVIPFGKHKGKTIEEIQNFDPAYLHWLIAQDWFRDKFVVLYQTIIHGAEPQETPEHNALQALFLNDEFCLKVARATGRNIAGNEKIFRRTFEDKGVDVKIVMSGHAPTFAIEIKPTVGDDYPAVLRQIRALVPVEFYAPDAILFLERYTGTGATREQFIEIFKNSGVHVVFLEQVR